jgi:hypothetical protein
MMSLRDGVNCIPISRLNGYLLGGGEGENRGESQDASAFKRASSASIESLLLAKFFV